MNSLTIGEYTLPLPQKTLVMGIINTTPDSFSDGGRYRTVEKALRHASRLAQEGADILDIGGESTRPGATPVSQDEELERIIPIIERITQEVPLPISVDTYKAEVARQAIQAGAHIINDVWGAKKDPKMPEVMGKMKIPVILMHNRKHAFYHSLMEDIKNDLLQSVSLVKSAGVLDEHIILDPGIGFAKSYEENLQVMRSLDQIVKLGYPVLLGTSHKSLIGNTLQLPPDERLEGTAATVALGITKGCRIVRVHDVKAMVRVARMMDAMLYGV